MVLDDYNYTFHRGGSPGGISIGVVRILPLTIYMVRNFRQIDQGNLDLVCPEIRVPSTFSVFHYSTLSDDPESWQNVSFAHRLGLNSIRIGDDYDILHP